MTNITYQAKIFSSISILAIIVAPSVVMGAGLVPCGGGGGEPICDFNQLIVMTNNIISFLLFKVAIPLAALGFMVAGAMLVLMPNKEGEWTKAKERFESIGMGFLIILGSFLLVKLVLFTFLNTDAGFTSFLLS